MAKRDDEEDDDASERESDEAEDEAPPAAKPEADGPEGEGDESEDEPGEKRELEVGDDVGALVEGSEGVEEGHSVQQMGAQRYVIAAFLAATMLGAYVLGLTIHGVWAWASNRDFFALRFPSAAAVADESKMTWGTIVGAIIAIAYAVKQYRDPEVRTWTDDVASELTKVKWPTKKDVTNSTIVVIAASAFAMVYLFLLDRLWGFVTGLIYGAGT
jgi:preprotein translocase subunit SecE